MPDEQKQHAERLLDIVNDAARAVGTRFVTFLTVGVYIALTIAATTDEMVVRASLVTLPLLNTKIPISGLFGFYTIAPWLIVFLHWDLLLQLSMLDGKLSRFRGDVDQLPAEQATQLRDRVASSYYVQFLLCDPSRIVVLSRLIIGLSMIVYPLGLLLATQVRFLPFHSSDVTWLHRVAVIVDFLLILFLWPELSAANHHAEAQPAGWFRKLASVPPLVGLVCVTTLVLCLLVATIPEDAPEASPVDQPSTSIWSTVQSRWFAARNLNLREKVLTANALSAEAINALNQGDLEEQEQELKKVSPLNFLQGHDLRYANLFHAVLPKLDLRTQRADSGRLIVTRLRGADLRYAAMQRVLLDEADLRQADLEAAELQGASLWLAQLQEANLSAAHLQEARLGGAGLQRARAANAQLQGADLSGAQLQDVDLSGGQLQGANLQRASLQGADLSGAALQGADLSDAHLEGANLRAAKLQGAVLRGTVISGADFKDANLDLTDPLPVTQPHAIEGAKFGRCREAQSAVFKQCTGQSDGVYLQNLMRCLIDLACADAYIARGLSWQTLHGSDPHRQLLATALTADESHLDCPGLKLLPATVKGDLERFAKSGVPSEATPSAALVAGKDQADEQTHVARDAENAPDHAVAADAPPKWFRKHITETAEPMPNT